MTLGAIVDRDAQCVQMAQMQGSHSEVALAVYTLALLQLCCGVMLCAPCTAAIAFGPL